MGKAATGLKYLRLGEDWRKLYLQGSTPIVIASQTGENVQVVSRAIWLAKVPNDIKVLLRTNPDVFTREVLLNAFAAKRRQCEKNGFKLLRAEVIRLIAKGAGTKPALKKTSKKRTKPITETKSKLSSVFRIQESMDLEYRLKTALGGLFVRVMFDENSRGGEVRVIFKDDKSLEFVIERIEDLGQNRSYKDNTKKNVFLGLID